MEQLLANGDALLIVDVQNDFLPGGRLGVPGGDRVVDAINRYIRLFSERGLPVWATRDWHPADHCSFREQGGPWPSHCVADSEGAAFAAGLLLPADAQRVSKATQPGQDAYSGFDGTDLAAQLRSRGVRRLYVGGLATDYCVLNTVLDALAAGFEVRLLRDAISAVEVHAGDGAEAIRKMRERGAVETELAELR